MAVFDWSPGGCCCTVGYWDYYQDGVGENADPPDTTYGSPFFSRTAAIYLDDDPPDNLVFDYDSYDAWFVTAPALGDWNQFQSKVTISSIATLGIISSELAYYYLGDGESDHLSKRRFVFATDLEGFSDVYDDDPDIVVQWDGLGALQFTTDGASITGSTSERAVWSGTWEDLNVPGGALVTGAELISIREKVEDVIETLDAHSFSVRITKGDDDFAPIMAGDLLADTPLDTSPEGSFSSVPGDGNQLLSDLTYQPSTSPIRIEIEYDLTVSPPSAGVSDDVIDFDNLFIAVTHTGTGINGNGRIDAENLEADWVVPESEWAVLEWSYWDYTAASGAGDTVLVNGVSPIGNITIVAPFGAGPTPALDDFDSNAIGAGWLAVMADGLVRWINETRDPFATPSAYAFQRWRIDGGGVISYEYEPAATIHWEQNNGGVGANPPHAIPIYSYGNQPYVYYGLVFPDPFSLSFEMHDRDLLAYHQPLGQAPQSGICVGIKSTHSVPLWNVGDYPDVDPSLWGYYIDFDGNADINIGHLEIDADGYTYVSGSSIWSKTVLDIHLSNVTLWGVGARLDGFDASEDADEDNIHSIAIITYMFPTGFTGDGGLIHPPTEYFTETANECRTALVIDGNDDQDERVFTSLNSSYDEDNRDWFPSWINPRVLQKSEAAQGDKQRVAVFQRYPFDSSQESGDGTLRQYDLFIYDCASPAAAEWGGDTSGIRSRFPMSSQGSGDMVLDLASTEPSQFPITAVGGGEADSTLVEVGDLHLDIVQGTEEDAEYNSATNTLTVTINISGGNDTVEDLRAVIDAAGDFATDVSSDDAATIANGDEGDATITSASDTPAGDVVAADPTIHDSSDRFFYLLGYPLRVRRLINNRWECFFIAESHTYPLDWRVSHAGDEDGPTSISPIGSGNDRTRRADFFTGTYSSSKFSSIKNSGRLPLTPGLEEI